MKKNFILYVGYDDHAEGDNHKYLENHSHIYSLFSFSSGQSQLNNIIFDALYLYFTSTNLRFQLYGQLPLAGLRPPRPHTGRDLQIGQHCKNSDLFVKTPKKAGSLPPSCTPIFLISKSVFTNCIRGSLLTFKRAMSLKS